jgi:hypothetical protein
MFTALGALALSLFSLASLNAEIPGPLPTRYAHPDPQQSVASFQYLTAISEKDFHTIGATTYIETFTISSPGTYVLVEDVGYQGRNGGAGKDVQGVASAIFINSSNVVLDLGNKTLYNNSGATLTSLQKGIDIAHNLHNISIKNGNIAGFQDTGIYTRSGCSNIRLQDLCLSKCIKVGIHLAGGINTAATDTLTINDCIIDNVMVSETVGITATTDAIGLYIENGRNILVNNSAFGSGNAGALAADEDSYGALISSSSHVRFYNCDASSNYGENAYGFYITGTATGAVLSVGSAGCSFINCTANNNQASANAGQAAGFICDGVNSCIWQNCLSNGNYGPTSGYGFKFNQARYSKALACQAWNNKAGTQGTTNAHGARGFYSGIGTGVGAGFLLPGVGNLWEDCIANGQQADSTDTDVMCIGFELSAEKYSVFRGCEASNNGENDDTPWGMGINLTSNCIDCVIDNCKIMHNKSETADHGIGIRDTNNAACTTLITNCFFYNNGEDDDIQNVHLNYSSGALSLTTTVDQTSVGSINATLQPYTNVTFTTSA